ncbi:hypothetical protein SIID45300_02431 [Candidatus Magnetaquicoccaceae bacterium FCR-1]|uniref:DNA-binding protein n=1 Tax=Candidatus Magnetaquiglobus chichijimensis TaxID=3141448 RepID=A0ABQ0CB38_9PROT
MKTEKTRIELLREFEDAPVSALFDQTAIAAVLGCSDKKLERDRWIGGGIPYRKIGNLVRYSKGDVLAAIDRCPLVNSTAACC